MKSRLVLSALSLALLLSLPVSALSLDAIHRDIPKIAKVAVKFPNYFPDDAEGTISLPHLARTMHAQNPTILSLQATLNAQNAYDFQGAKRGLVSNINDLVDAAADMEAYNPAGAAALNAQANQLHDQLDKMDEEDYAKQLEDINRQIQDAQTQLVMAAEGLYWNIIKTEAQGLDLAQALCTLERLTGELEQMLALGTATQASVQDLQYNYSQTQNKLDALHTGVAEMKRSLAHLLGADIRADLSLAPLPERSAYFAEVLSLNYETALAKAKAKSYTLYTAQTAMDEAQEEWDDKHWFYSETSNKYKIMQENYRSAQNKYQASHRQFELAFDNAHRGMAKAEDAYRQCEADIAHQETLVRQEEVKYAVGKISASALQEAKDKLQTAQNALVLADIDCFHAYLLYEQAVTAGYLPQS